VAVLGEVVGREAGDHPARHVVVERASPQAAAHVGRRYAQRLLVAVQRHDQQPLARQPEALLEPFGDQVRLPAQRFGSGLAEPPLRFQIGHAAKRCAAVGLDLDRCDRAGGPPTIGVHHRVAGVLPPLVDEPMGVGLVLDEAVAVEVTMALAPLQCPASLGEPGRHTVRKAPPAGSLGQQHDEQQRGIEGGGVGRSRRHAEHLDRSAAQLVEDAAGLLACVRVAAPSLVVCEIVQHVDGQALTRDQCRPGGHQRIPAKQGEEPRSAGTVTPCCVALCSRSDARSSRPPRIARCQRAGSDTSSRSDGPATAGPPACGAR